MKNSEIININELLQIVPPEKVLCLDTEGSANNIEQIAIIDCNEHILCDQHYHDTKLSDLQKKEIQSILNQAEILIGYNLNCDLKKLANLKLKLPEPTVCADIFLTFNSSAVQAELAERFAWLSQKGGTLASVAEYFEEGPGKFHDSLFDAFCTLRIFKKMIQRTKGEIVTTKPPMKRLSAEEIRAMESTPATATPTKATTKHPMIGNFKTMSKLLDNISGKIFGHFVDDHPAIYEGVININGQFHVIRLTHKEHALFCKIQKFNPQYSLNTFYETILRPAQLSKLDETETE